MTTAQASADLLAVRVQQTQPAGSVTPQDIAAVLNPPNPTVNTFQAQPPTQTVTPFSTVQAPVPAPVADPGTTSVIQTSSATGGSGLLDWAKQNPILAAAVIAGAVFVIPKLFKRR